MKGWGSKIGLSEEHLSRESNEVRVWIGPGPRQELNFYQSQESGKIIKPICKTAYLSKRTVGSSWGLCLLCVLTFPEAPNLGGGWGSRAVHCCSRLSSVHVMRLLSSSWNVVVLEFSFIDFVFSYCSYSFYSVRIGFSSAAHVPSYTHQTVFRGPMFLFG